MRISRIMPVAETGEVGTLARAIVDTFGNLELSILARVEVYSARK
jgi:hypothetical protein